MGGVWATASTGAAGTVPSGDVTAHPTSTRVRRVKAGAHSAAGRRGRSRLPSSLATKRRRGAAARRQERSMSLDSQEGRGHTGKRTANSDTHRLRGRRGRSRTAKRRRPVPENVPAAEEVPPLPVLGSLDGKAVVAPSAEATPSADIISPDGGSAGDSSPSSALARRRRPRKRRRTARGAAVRRLREFGSPGLRIRLPPHQTGVTAAITTASAAPAGSPMPKRRKAAAPGAKRPPRQARRHAPGRGSGAGSGAGAGAGSGVGGRTPHPELPADAAPPSIRTALAMGSPIIRATPLTPGQGTDGEGRTPLPRTGSRGSEVGPHERRALRRRKRFHATHAAFLRRLARLEVVRKASVLFPVSDSDVPKGYVYPDAIPVYTASMHATEHDTIIKVVGKDWRADLEIKAHTTLSKVAGACVVPLVCEPLTLSCNRRALAMRRVTVGFGKITTVEQFMSKACELFDALAVWHDNCWVHCDLKPTNVGVDPQSGVLHLFDLGLSMQLPAPGQPVRAGGPVGTEDYMAPEVRSKKAGHMYGPAADVYSASLTVLAMLNAAVEARGSLRQAAQAGVSQFLCGNLRKLLAKGSTKKAGKRPSARAMANTIRHLLAQASLQS